jgi:hypothetical protein
MFIGNEADTVFPYAGYSLYLYLAGYRIPIQDNLILTCVDNPVKINFSNKQIYGLTSTCSFLLITVHTVVWCWMWALGTHPEVQK